MKNQDIGASPLQMPGRPTPRALVLTISATLAFANASIAQETSTVTADPAMTPEQPGLAPEQPELTPGQEALAQDFYRAEFVIVERRIEPSEVEEKMASRLPEPPDLQAEEILLHTGEAGDTQTTLKLVPQQELYLRSAANRLERSGRYRVLLAEGWYQAFPPDFEGKPLWVAIGDWLPDAEHTDVQGMITIDRQRYLHVDVRLNHWVPASPKDNLLGIDLNAETPTRPRPPRIAIRPAENANDSSDQDSPPVAAEAGGDSLTGSEPETASSELKTEGAVLEAEQTERTLVAGLNWPRAELLTWIRETRRMRSEEVHFLDSPTLGVLIFFKKIEPEDAAPLIMELGITAEQLPPEAP